ncbi:MAG TPA: hypothetical protein VJA16_13490 [Thermoanaerobaculia bacterium]
MDELEHVGKAAAAAEGRGAKAGIVRPQEPELLEQNLAQLERLILRSIRELRHGVPPAAFTGVRPSVR